jgi:hypothetical protein
MIFDLDTFLTPKPVTFICPLLSDRRIPSVNKQRKSKGMEKMTQNPSQKPKNRVRSALKWAMIGLPLGGIVWTSFLPVQVWVQQALILITLIWFYVFYIMDTFFMGG